MQTMKHSIRSIRLALVAALVGAVAFGTAAQAQAPAPAGAAQAPLRLIVPFTPGTGIDLIARTVGPKLSCARRRTVRPCSSA